MINKLIKDLTYNKELIDELDFSNSTNHYKLLQLLTTLLFEIEAIYELVPNDDKNGSFEMIQIFNKYFTDIHSNKKFAKGLQQAKELKGNFKKLVELVTKYMKQRTDLKENVFEWKTSRKHFGTVLKEIKEFLYKFLEANPIKDKNNILSQATDIINTARKNDNKDISKLSKNLDRIKSEFHKNVDILNNLNEVQSEDESCYKEITDDELEEIHKCLNEIDEEDDEYEENDFINPRLLDGTIMGVISNDYMNLEEAPRSFPDFKMKTDGIYQINLNELAAEIFSNAVNNFENNKNHITRHDLFKRLSLKASFKSNSSTAKFLRNLMDAISQMIKGLAIAADEDTGELPMTLPIFKLGLIYDLIAKHLSSSIKNKKE